jgi:hypothetical protein
MFFSDGLFSENAVSSAQEDPSVLFPVFFISSFHIVIFRSSPQRCSLPIPMRPHLLSLPFLSENRLVSLSFLSPFHLLLSSPIFYFCLVDVVDVDAGCYTLEGLVRVLADEYDMKLRATFFLTLSSFATPIEVLDSLK